MSVGNTSDGGNISIFTDEKVQVYKDTDVMFTCKGKLIIISKLEERGRYHIQLMHTRGKLQLRKPSKKSKKFLQEAYSVYEFYTTEESVKWMHTICVYPVKYTWIKAIKLRIR